MSNFLESFKSLINKDGSAAPAEDLNGKILGLYFSAHWCGPCRKFTPMLVAKYNEIIAAGHKFEIIFVSADEDEEAALAYFAEMPWKMINYVDRDTESSLSELYKVQGIPTLVLLDEGGNLITNDGRSALMETPFEDLKGFAAAKKAAEEKAAQELAALQSAFNPSQFFTSENLIGKDGPVDANFTLDGKIIGLYFSAHWCPPCQRFTPLLAKKYTELTEEGKNFEIIFISSDRDESSAQHYYSEMPWKMLSYSRREQKKLLSELFEVEGIPTLILLDGQEKITSDGVEAIMSTPFDRLKTYAEDKRIAEEVAKLELEALKASFNPSTYFAGDLVIDKDGNVVPSSFFSEGKIFGIYFSAHWCPPCQRFTPELANRYKELVADGKNFEIIFISFDRDESSAASYYGDMPWKMMKYGEDSKKKQLAELFEIEGIPALVLVDESGVISTEGREIVMDSPFEEWKSKK